GVSYISAGGLDFFSSLAIEVFGGEFVSAVAGPDFVINALNFSLDGFNHLRPDISMLFFGPCVGGSPDVVGAGGVCFVKQSQVFVIDFAGGLGLVVFQAYDVVGTQGGGTNIGRIQECVIGEDD